MLSKAEIKKIIQLVLGEDNKDPLISELMYLLWKRGEAKLTQLYGNDVSLVIDKCLSVSPYFCFQVVTNIYGVWWSSQVITDYQKSLVTIVALLSTAKMNQFSVLLNTFLSTGGSHSKLKSIIELMHADQTISEKVYQEVSGTIYEVASKLNDEEIYLVKMASLIAVGKSIEPCFELNIPVTLSKDRVVFSINHLLTYLGCPVVWDATVEFNECARQ